ncbi:MAG: biotin--[acetyl-CoA-carboxylase] ligase [Alistipes sp.]|nr:biotin--[acetyl-CoA-carboxylase] ligase [Alistipes sp.]
MKEKILKMLSETEGYVSGQRLCGEFHVSRTAVWKNIKRLRDEGYVIRAVTGKGYRLEERPDVISAQEIKSRLKTKYWGQKTVFFEEVDSTNNVAKKMAEDGAPHGSLVIAENQNAGKGRRGRSWSSPEGTGIWMTFILRPRIEPQAASMLTLVAAMAVRKAVFRETGLETVIKWPNDLVAGGKKICGILTEMSAEPEQINYVAVGVGINANIRKFPDEISGVATSLLLETGKKADRSKLVAAYGNAFEEYYDRFMEKGNLELLKEEYNGYLANFGNQVKILDPAGEFTGISGGINDFGELLVTDGEGRKRTIRSGEVSVRGIYGYV